MLAANQAALDGGSKVAELQAATALQAQGQLASALQGVRGQDVDVAAKKAALEQERKNLQAQLDQARAAGDQNAINAAQTKMAELDQRTREFNASEANKAQARSEDQSFQAQDINNQTGLEVSRLTEEQRIANEKLKLEASEAATRAAKGLLDENDRKAQLDLAHRKIQEAKDAADKAFWQGIVTSADSARRRCCPPRASQGCPRWSRHEVHPGGGGRGGPRAHPAR